MKRFKDKKLSKFNVLYLGSDNDLNFQISRKKNINAYIIFTSGSTGNQKAVLITAKGYID